jgi:hypothetical protein
MRLALAIFLIYWTPNYYRVRNWNIPITLSIPEQTWTQQNIVSIGPIQEGVAPLGIFELQVV